MTEPYLELEEEFAKFAGYPKENMVLCSSGTSALHLALEAMQLPTNSTVVVPELTMIACPRAVSLARLKPIFWDCYDDLLVDILRFPTVNSFQAVMPVHIYGRKCDMVSVVVWAKENKAKIVEDLAEAHGVKPHPLTDAACYSFYRNKIIAGEEGGAVAFKDVEHAKLARQLRSMGFTDKHDFLHVPFGHNYRMSNAHASLILPSLRNFEENTVKRRQVESWYNETVPENWHMPPRDAVWVYDVRVPENVNTTELVGRLNSQKIAARLCFKPMSMQAEFYNVYYKTTNAYRLSNRVIYLPVSPAMTKDDVKNIVEKLLD